MVKIKSSSDIDKSFRDAIGRAATKYSDGVARTTDWQERASSENAENLWAQRVQEAAAAKRRQKSVSAVSNSEWQNRARNIGAQRIGPGMQANAEKRTRNFEPYRSAIEGLSLTERTADPVANIDRVRQVVTTLVATKKAIKG